MLIRIFNRIYRFLQSNKILKFTYYSILFLYPIVFLYSYNRIGINAIGLHTNLIVPLYLIVLCEFISKKYFPGNSFFLNLRHFTIIYLIIESLLIIVRPYHIYYSNFYGQYESLYDAKAHSYYHIRKPHEKYHLKQSEFDYTRTANSLGIPDKEWSERKENNTIRILCLGDSFTEGDGAHTDSSYASFMGRSLSKQFPNIEVMNGGRCGSDPFYDFELLKDILIQYQPDIVVQSFTTNDFFFDMVIKGGSERFQKDRKLKYRKKYWWEPVYAASFTARIIIQLFGGYDKYLIKQKEYSVSNKEIENKSIELFKNYQSFTQKRNIDLVVFSLPFKSDFQTETRNSNFHKKFKTEFAQFYLEFYNLQPCYENEFKKSNTSYKDYHWKNDGHHNARGYEMMAKCIEDIVTPVIEKRIANKNTLVN